MAKSLISMELDIKKAPYKSAFLALKNKKKALFLVQNKENQLLHKLSYGRIWVVQALTFCIYFSNFGNYIHSFSCTIISLS